MSQLSRTHGWLCTQPKFITWGPKESLLHICNILFPLPFTECLIAISEIFLLRWNFLHCFISSRNGPVYTKVQKQIRNETKIGLQCWNACIMLWWRQLKENGFGHIYDSEPCKYEAFIVVEKFGMSVCAWG